MSHNVSPHSCKFCPSGEKGQKDSPPSSEDSKASGNKPQRKSITSDSSTPSSVWTKEILTTAGNTLSNSLYKSFTPSSLLRVLMHTTQPLFNGRTRHSLLTLHVSALTFSALGSCSTQQQLCVNVPSWWVDSWT